MEFVASCIPPTNNAFLQTVNTQTLVDWESIRRREQIAHPWVLGSLLCALQPIHGNDQQRTRFRSLKAAFLSRYKSPRRELSSTGTIAIQTIITHTQIIKIAPRLEFFGLEPCLLIVASRSTWSGAYISQCQHIYSCQSDICNPRACSMLYTSTLVLWVLIFTVIPFMYLKTHCEFVLQPDVSNSHVNSRR